LSDIWKNKKNVKELFPISRMQNMGRWKFRLKKGLFEKETLLPWDGKGECVDKMMKAVD
jgi:hypothetical protein